MRTRDGLHARLRAATDPAHRALEASLDWQARVATLSGYRNDDVLVSGHGPLLVQVAARLVTLPNPPLDFRAERATLEDVFLSLTGREVRD